MGSYLQLINIHSHVQLGAVEWQDESRVCLWHHTEFKEDRQSIN